MKTKPPQPRPATPAPPRPATLGRVMRCMNEKGETVPALVLPLDPASVFRMISAAGKLCIGRHAGCCQQHSEGIAAAFDALGITALTCKPSLQVQPRRTKGKKGGK